MFDMEKWKQEKRSVTLTNEEWNNLSFLIRMTTKYREDERDSWVKLAEERKPDGSIRFIHAADNAQFWKELNDSVDQIVRKLDGIEITP